MLHYITEALPQPKSRARPKDPALRVKSYLLQEAEATARAAKCAWCEHHGFRVLSLQHDGIVLGAPPAGQTWADVEQALTAAASHACGYPVVVEAKDLAAPALAVN